MTDSLEHKADEASSLRNCTGLQMSVPFGNYKLTLHVVDNGNHLVLTAISAVEEESEFTRRLGSKAAHGVDSAGFSEKCQYGAMRCR